MFSSPLFNDIGFEVGGNFGINNDYLASDTTVGVFGLNFDVAIPKPLGTWLIGIMGRKEFTFNNFNSCGPAVGGGVGFNVACFAGGSFSGNRDFQWTWTLESSYSLPLSFLGTWAEPVRFFNNITVIGPKGTGISTAQCNAIGAGGSCSGVGFLGTTAFNSNEIQNRSQRRCSSRLRYVEDFLEQSWHLGNLCWL